MPLHVATLIMMAQGHHDLGSRRFPSVQMAVQSAHVTGTVNQEELLMVPFLGQFMQLAQFMVLSLVHM